MRNILPKKTIVFGLKSIVVIFFTAMLFACENRMETIRELTSTDTIPSEMAFDIRIIYSDSARVQMILTSPILYQIGGQEPYVEFPEGLHVKTFDEANNLVTELEAEYGKRYTRQKLIEVEKNVIVTNHQSDKQLLTEHLFWNEISKKIYNSEFVTIIEKGRTVHGDSMRADQNFDKLELFSFRATIEVKDEEIK